jgi:hypothetical protein
MNIRTSTLLLFVVVVVVAIDLRSALSQGSRKDLCTISFATPRAGRVSLAVYDSDGRMVRTLQTGTPLNAGEHAVTWDGLDRYGKPLPAGEYTWKLINTTGLRAEFITQIGQNVEPAWERATGNHESPRGAAIDATGLYRVGATNEGGHYAVKTDLDGKHLWAGDRWSADPWAQGTVAVCLVRDRLFELMPNGDLYGYDAKTGRVFTGGNYDPKPWNLCWDGFVPPANPKDEEKRKLRAKECPSELAADSHNELIVAAYSQYDAVVWYSAKNGMRVGAARGLNKLAGVTCRADGVVLAIVDGAVVSFSREQPEPRVVIAAEELQSPWRLTATAAGDILIAENSSRSPSSTIHHQVKRFDSAGKWLKSYGKSTGRVDGEYVATDFRGLTDIEADSAGGFIITEGDHTPPRRTARFDLDGKLLREWYGAQHYGVIAAPEPADPRFVWTLANAPQQGLVRWEIDYSSKKWRVAEVYQDVFAANKYAVAPQVPDVFEKDGRIYIQGGALQPSGLSLVIYDPKSKTLRPCAASGKKDKKPYLWLDRNDDGKATDDELDWTLEHQIGGWVSPLTLTLFTTPTPTDYRPGGRYDPVGVTAAGTPLYSAQATGKLTPVNEAGGSFFAGDYRIDSAGSTYGSFADPVKNPHEGVETHGAWYYNSCSAVDRLVKWDKSGKQVWSVGRHSPDADHETGSTAMARGLVGLTNDCVIWGDASDEEAARPTVWTTDGLYVDELLRVPTDSIPKEAYGIFNANEYPCGRLHTNPSTGEVLYFALNSGGGAPVYRITGWEGWQRLEGKISLKNMAEAVALRDGVGVTGEYFNTPDCSGKPTVTRLDQLVFFNWGKGTPDKAITADAFSVRWTGQYEAATNETVRFEVRGSFPWRERGRPTFVKLWLNGKLVIDSSEEYSYARLRLSAGQRVDLKLECGFKRGEAAVALSHDTPGLDRRAVLPEFLHPQVTGERSVIEQVIDSRPVVLAQFDFEEKNGALSWSAVGGGVFGRLTGDASRVPGKLGNGVALAAKGEFAPALFPIDEELRLPDSDYAISFWFKTTDTDLRLCEAKRYSSYNNRWSDHVVSIESGKLRFTLAGDEPLLADVKVADGEWRHVVTSIGPGGQRLYLDGKLIGTGKLTRRTRTSNRLGLDIGPAGGAGAVIFDQLVIFGRSIGQDEVSRLFESPSR